MKHEIRTAIEAPRVLVAEDDLFFSVRIETVLKKMGYEVEVVTDEARAVARAAEWDPALVIVNFGSERLSPADLVRRIKGRSPSPAVLGFVSHTWMPQVKPAAMAAGCDLMVANSALVTRLPQFAAKLAPLPEPPTR
jgi:CheY-like chemotaxis protein